MYVNEDCLLMFNIVRGLSPRAGRAVNTLTAAAAVYARLLIFTAVIALRRNTNTHKKKQYRMEHVKDLWIYR